MRLERRDRVIAVILDDGSERSIEGISLAPHVDHGMRNWYGSELRAEWEEAHLHRLERSLFLTVTHLYESCGDLTESPLSVLRSDDGGRTWVRDSSLRALSQDTVIAAVTTHPSEQPFYRGLPKRS